MGIPKHSSNQLRIEMKSQSCVVTQERRCANYKPNIWSYDFIQSLTSDFEGATYIERAKKLKDEFVIILNRVPVLFKPLMVETIVKLGLSNVLHKEINDILHTIVSNLHNDDVGFKEDLLSAALCFRLLRQHGYNASQDFIGEMGLDDLKDRPGSTIDLRGVLELYEASHLATNNEETMLKAKAYSYKYLMDHYFDMDANLAKQVAYASEFPSHRKVLWFNVRQQISTYKLEDDKNQILLDLAKLNFNIVQAMHLNDLKEMSQWWKKLGLIENVGFARDRLMESFLWTVGVAYEPQHALLRKCLTKVVMFVLVLDDMYDIYGSLDELECFTRTMERWDYQEIDQLPECMKICFKALVTTTNEIVDDIEKENGWNNILPFLKIAWVDFCEGMLQEARWYKKRYTPTLQDYLSSAWITSSGPLLSVIAFLCTAHGKSEELKNKWEDSHDLIYHTSIIIRLLNDQGTSAAELERGDAHSSIMCYMAEASVTEDIARKHMKAKITSAWSKINMELLTASKEQQKFVECVINMARVCHFIYQSGDGFSVQDGATKNKVKRLFFEPLEL
ncbi:Alpha-farnesene synthase [Bienertia sinuspersici]